ncbi:MAG: LysR family transcriptional regulator [Synechococcales cyanobacterium RU_4_20]|nr:LysR family transcriptional regulator [Synechococcales cyanobacterium RU_4_20]
MNITHLNILLAVVEHKSFSTAADALAISQSAVSRAIAALESELGVSLLSRGRFGAYPTPMGERILPYAQQILQTREKIDATINREKSLYGGRVRLASFRSAATHLLPPLIAQFRRRFPLVEVSLMEDDPTAIEQALREGKVDLGLIPLPRSSEDLETWEIARDEFVLLLPPSLAHLSTQPCWQDLENCDFILLNYAECTPVVREHWQRAGQPLKEAYSIREDSTIVSMVSQDLGVAVLPRLAALPLPEGVEVRPLPVKLERSIGAVMLKTVLHSAAVFLFLDLLRGTGQFSQRQLDASLPITIADLTSHPSNP